MLSLPVHTLEPPDFDIALLLIDKSSYSYKLNLLIDEAQKITYLFS
jgi:hypothetical protein